MPPLKQFNLNTIIGSLTVAGMLITGVFFIAPLRTLPADVGQMKQTQIIQTEAIKTLADVAKDSKELRRDFDRHAAASDAKDAEHDRALERVQRQLERLPVK
jgi:hypothetical protein